jgi:Sulfatase
LRVRTLVVDAAHVAALSGFAIAQPIFNLLADTSQFFGVRGSTSTEIVVFAVAIVLLPFLVALMLEWLVGLAGEGPRLVLHLSFVAGLLMLIALRALKEAFDPPSGPLTLAALALGVAGAVFYRRVEAGRSIVTVLIPAPLIFLVIFLFFSPVEKLVSPPEARASLAGEKAKTSVVFLILDEFPTSSLMTRAGKIDARRYPSFGDLARHSTWFRNATGEHEGTHAAVPAILDSRLPQRGRQPTFADHPQNLFTLLGGRYRMNVWETQTHLCPTTLCRGKGELSNSFVDRMHSLFEDAGIVYLHMVVPTSEEKRLPDVSTSWGHYRRVAERGARFERGRFEKFIASIRGPGSRPSLDLAHVLLPHGTWELLPSCRQDITPDYSPGLVVPENRWGSNRWLVAQAYQRQLLQLSCTDRLLGDFLRKLRETGAYDRSLVIVTADQGVSVEPGESRRSVDPAHPTNLADLAFVPLFIKRPGQRQGAVVDTHVRTLDIVPTIADVLGIEVPWRHDGRSVFGADHSPQVDFLTDRGLAQAKVGRLAAERNRTVREKAELFGRGILDLGPHPELRGRRVLELRVSSAAARATIDADISDLLRSLPAGSDIVPAQVMGSIRGPGAAADRPLALAVDGRIAATSLTYVEGSTVRYSAMAPESALHPGRNEVELFWIAENRGRVTLEQLAR